MFFRVVSCNGPQRFRSGSLHTSLLVCVSTPDQMKIFKVTRRAASFEQHWRHVDSDMFGILTHDMWSMLEICINNLGFK